MNETTRNKLPLPARVSQDGLFLLGLQQLISKTLGSGASMSPLPTPLENRCEVPQNVITNTSRKRKNTGLSEAEKRQKRMVMNRVAAQNAREKRRQYVEELERKLSQLEAQNKQLTRENQLLKAEASRLVLGKGQVVEIGTNPASVDVLESSQSCRSAAPQVSQQKKQALRAILLHTWMLVSCLVCSLENSGLKGACLQATVPQMVRHVPNGFPSNRHLILTLRASWRGVSPPHLKEPP